MLAWRFIKAMAALIGISRRRRKIMAAARRRRRGGVGVAKCRWRRSVVYRGVMVISPMKMAWRLQHLRRKPIAALAAAVMKAGNGGGVSGNGIMAAVGWLKA